MKACSSSGPETGLYSASAKSADATGPEGWMMVGRCVSSKSKTWLVMPFNSAAVRMSVLSSRPSTEACAGPAKGMSAASAASTASCRAAPTAQPSSSESNARLRASTGFGNVRRLRIHHIACQRACHFHQKLRVARSIWLLINSNPFLTMAGLDPAIQESIVAPTRDGWVAGHGELVMDASVNMNAQMSKKTVRVGRPDGYRSGTDSLRPVLSRRSASIGVLRERDRELGRRAFSRASGK